MNRSTIVWTIAISLSCFSGDALAHGGGGGGGGMHGGGGGGGGGMHGGGYGGYGGGERSMSSHSPSMSHSPGWEGRSAGAASHGAGYHPDDNHSQHWQQSQDRGRDIRNDWANQHHDAHNWYNHQWWHDHPHPHWNFPYHYPWWNLATWGAVLAWDAGDWGAPIYYDYGPGGNVYCENETVYIDGQPAYSTDEYAQQATKIAASVPKVESAKVQWMPLGVFAVADKADGKANMVVQLAVSKEGIIAGTYQDTRDGSVVPIEGMVDKTTQRAVWKPVGKDGPTMETGIYNLTNEQTNALVYTGEGEPRQWFMARLKAPETAAPKTPEAPAAAPAARALPAIPPPPAPAANVPAPKAPATPKGVEL